MYELIQVAGHSYYVQSPAKIGLVKLSENEVCLIDSGSDKDAGRKVRQMVHEIADKIVEICGEPLCFEVILQKLLADYGLKMNFEQYVLVGSTVGSYLAWLKDTGRLQARFEDNLLLWERL